jgi:hypothetical protein
VSLFCNAKPEEAMELAGDICSKKLLRCDASAKREAVEVVRDIWSDLLCCDGVAQPEAMEVRDAADDHSESLFFCNANIVE